MMKTRIGKPSAVTTKIFTNSVKTYRSRARPRRTPKTRMALGAHRRGDGLAAPAQAEAQVLEPLAEAAAAGGAAQVVHAQVERDGDRGEQHVRRPHGDPRRQHAARR